MYFIVRLLVVRHRRVHSEVGAERRFSTSRAKILAGPARGAQRESIRDVTAPGSLGPARARPRSSPRRAAPGEIRILRKIARPVRHGCLPETRHPEAP
jgi:hypothetical protein